MPKEMEFRTKVELPEYDFAISPGSRLLFAGSCFADNIGSRFGRSRFHAVVNPYGTMYNPVSVLHTIERTMAQTDFVPDIVFLTLGTNHVYRLKETGEIVDNCMKRPQSLFIEECLSIDDCACGYDRNGKYRWCGDSNGIRRSGSTGMDVDLCLLWTDFKVFGVYACDQIS